jgi:hypothetical protein
MLKKITYPTGGYSEFEYEGNDYGTSNKATGGLRVSKTTAFDGMDQANNIVKEFEYRKESNQSQSSGILVSMPTPYFYFDEGAFGVHVQSSVSVVPLGSVSGSHIGYSEVAEIIHHRNTTSKTIHKYYTNTLGVSSPYPLATDDADKPYGREVESKFFNSSGDLLFKKTNTYSENYEYTIWSRKVKLLGIDQGTNEPLIAVGKYKDRDIWDYVSSSETTWYDKKNISNSESTFEDYYYSDSYHKQLTKKIETNSNGDKRITEITYAHTVNSGSLNYTAMKNKNMLSQIYSISLKDESNKLIAEKHFLWKNNNYTNYRWMAYKKEAWSGDSNFISNGEILNVDSYNNPTRIIDAKGNTTKFYYRSNNNPFSSGNINGVTGVYLTGTQKVIGSINTPTSGDDLYTHYKYDGFGRITDIYNESDDNVFFTYDNMSRLKEEFNENGERVSRYGYYYSKNNTNASYDSLNPNRIETITYSDPINDTTKKVIDVTYLDGLGREIQTQQRGGGKTLVTGTVYNDRGLPEAITRPIELTNRISFVTDLFDGTSSFEPEGQGLGNNSLVENYYDSLGLGVDTDYAFSYTTYEKSPLARPAVSTLPGASHKMGSGKEITTTYGLNTTEAFATDAQDDTPAKNWGGKYSE